MTKPCMHFKKNLIYLYGKIKHFYMLLSKQVTTYYILLMEILHVLFLILFMFQCGMDSMAQMTQSVM